MAQAPGESPIAIFPYPNLFRGDRVRMCRDRFACSLSGAKRDIEMGHRRGASHGTSDARRLVSPRAGDALRSQLAWSPRWEPSGFSWLGATLNLRQIQVLAAVVEFGSVTKAAKFLNVTQPAVTKRIRELEKDLGVQLIERSGRGIVTTRFGDAFLRHGRAILAEIARASEAMAELRNAPETEVRVGALPNAAYGLVPAAVALLLRDSPCHCFHRRGHIGSAYVRVAPR